MPFFLVFVPQWTYSQIEIENPRFLADTSDNKEINCPALGNVQTLQVVWCLFSIFFEVLTI